MHRDNGTRAILLDALGTLVALEPPAPQLRIELANRLGISVSETEAAEAIAAEISYYRAHLDEGRDAPSLAALRARCAAELKAALAASLEADSGDEDGWTEVLLASLRFRVYPDVLPALSRASARGVRLVVVSNWDVSLHDVLGRLGIARSLDGILTSAEVGARKPAPAIFERALALAGVTPERAIHVGDSIEEDVEGARATGIAPVFLSRDGAPGPPGVRTINSLSELET